VSRLHTILADVQGIAAHLGFDTMSIVEHADEVIEESDRQLSAGKKR